jgi:hypothetical protein
MQRGPKLLVGLLGGRRAPQRAHAYAAEADRVVRTVRRAVEAETIFGHTHMLLEDERDAERSATLGGIRVQSEQFLKRLHDLMTLSGLKHAGLEGEVRDMPGRSRSSCAHFEARFSYFPGRRGFFVDRAPHVRGTAG